MSQIYKFFKESLSATDLFKKGPYFIATTTSVTVKKTVIDAEILHPLEYKSHKSNPAYPYPYGTITSPNYPKNYSNNIVRIIY